MRINVQKTYKLYINGQFERSESGRYFVYETKKRQLIANICRASRKDFKNAVVSARNAQPTWAKRSAYNRAQILYRIAEMLEGRKAQFIEDLTLGGVSKTKAEKEVLAATDRLVYFAGWADKYVQIFSSVNPVASSHFNFSLPEPVGVVSIISSESSPLLGLVSAMAPVIAGGNTCVILASFNNPLSALTLSEVLETSDIPAGVINILTGFRDELIAQFSSHMDIDSVFLISNDEIELKTTQENAALNVKRVKQYPDKDWHNDSFENPYIIQEFQEIKTTWHPVGI